MSSIRGRLMLILMAATGVVWLLAALWINISTSREVNHVLDRRLEEAAHMVASLIEGGDVSVAMATHGMRPAGDYDVMHQLSCQVWGFDGTLIGDSEGAPQAELSTGQPGFSENTVEGAVWRVFTLERADLGLRVMVGDARAMRVHLVQGVIMGLLIPTLLMLPLLAALIWWAVGRGVMPLDRMGAVLAGRPAHDLSPLDDTRAPREVRPMVSALNGLLRRVSGARERERSFTAFAAHELKTPLAGLQTQAEIARLAPDEATRRKALDQLSRAVGRTDRMVKQLLEMTAAEHAPEVSGQLPQDAGALLAGVVADLRPLAESGGLTLSCEAPRGLWSTGCAPLLRAALRNLVENALFASPEGGTVEVSLRMSGAEVLFRVADRGAGIPEADRPHVTERFFRSAASKGSGSGLGLAIVAAAMERMGGSFSLSPRPGGGELAEIRLPAAPRPGCG